MKDKYKSFYEMQLYEKENFNINYYNLGNPDIVILAIHGGEIEPLTTEIAKMIANNEFNYYILEGKDIKDVNKLHITSTNFDDEKALNMVANSKITISIHGCKDEKPIIYLGGLDFKLRNFIENEIKREFIIQNKEDLIIKNKEKHKFSAENLNNIVNKNKRKAGVQIEFSKGFRKKIISSFDSNRKIINIKLLYNITKLLNKIIKEYYNNGFIYIF